MHDIYVAINCRYKQRTSKNPWLTKQFFVFHGIFGAFICFVAQSDLLPLDRFTGLLNVETHFFLAQNPWNLVWRVFYSVPVNSEYVNMYVYIRYIYICVCIPWKSFCQLFLECFFPIKPALILVRVYFINSFRGLFFRWSTWLPDLPWYNTHPLVN